MIHIFWSDRASLTLPDRSKRHRQVHRNSNSSSKDCHIAVRHLSLGVHGHVHCVAQHDTCVVNSRRHFEPAKVLASCYGISSLCGLYGADCNKTQKRQEKLRQCCRSVNWHKHPDIVCKQHRERKRKACQPDIKANRDGVSKTVLPSNQHIYEDEQSACCW